jgi:hypothetical protein
METLSLVALGRGSLMLRKLYSRSPREGKEPEEQDLEGKIVGKK